MTVLKTAPLLLSICAFSSHTQPYPDSSRAHSGGSTQRLETQVGGRRPPVERTDSGLLAVRLRDGRLHYELPRAALDVPMLLVTTIARTRAGNGSGAETIDNRVVRWERDGGRVLLRNVSYSIRGDSVGGAESSVARANYDAILAAFPIESWGADSAPVVEVTRLFTAPPSEIGVTKQYRGTLDPGRTFLRSARAFAANIEVEATATLTSAATGSAVPQSESYLVHWSMVRMPERPMRARRCDLRTNARYLMFRDFSSGRLRFTRGLDSQVECVIKRFRLEKRNPGAAVSDPVTPIAFYVDRSAPAWARPWIRRGVESWGSAFEAAGFRNAIVARDDPLPEEIPDWSPFDARYSVIRWVATEGSNAGGSNLVDPRSGEILRGMVVIQHNVASILRDWYLLQAGAVDDRAWQVPMPDSLLGRLLQYTVAHEVGHAIGFDHNLRSSATYPVDSLRSRTFAARMGFTPSVMDYARVNYVAQPEDRIALDDLIGRVGPWDRWAVHWAYAPIPTAATPDDETDTLNRWARDHWENPWFTQGIPYELDRLGASPYDYNGDAVGDADPVKSTALGLRNLDRIAKRLVTDGSRLSTEEIQALYPTLVAQWANEVRAVVSVIGSSPTDTTGVLRFSRFPAVRQREAMRFVAEHGFATPRFLLDPLLVRRVDAEGALTHVAAAQRGLLSAALNESRIARMIGSEALGDDPNPYSVAEYLQDIRQAVFRELAEQRVSIDPYRRALQQAFADEVQARLTAVARPRTFFRPSDDVRGATGEMPPPPTNDLKAVVRAELATLSDDIRNSVARAGNPMTLAHLRALAAQLNGTLESR